MTTECLPQDREPAIRVLAMPTDTNAAVDIAGSITAFRRARGRVVTVAVNSFEFHQPVFVGDLISCYGDVIRVGRTSLAVKVEVYAERNRQQEECIKVTEAVLTFVAVDERRKPRVVPRDEAEDG
jgi:acyl-CoA thioesterase YciA